MNLQSEVTLLSSHHGDYRRPNVLADALRVTDTYEEIDIYEVDFVSDGARIISSHDYEEEAIARGSPMEEWVREFVVKRRKVLWLDIKENLALFFSWGYAKFSPRLLFHKLNTEWKAAVNGAEELDIRSRVWIGCQEPGLRERLRNYNDRYCGGRWRMMYDMPDITAYILQRVTPHCMEQWLFDYVEAQARSSEYAQFDLLSLDRAFFTGPNAMKRFLLSLELRPGTLVVLNSFSRKQEPLTLPGLTIVMQYDYTTKG
jgi:hypothetical protein